MIDPYNDQLSVGLIVQLVEHRTGIAEVRVSVPFRLTRYYLRTAACKNRESSVNDHFSGSLIFCPEVPFSELFSKNIFTSFSDSYFFGNLRKFENAVFVRFSIRQIVQNLLREPSNGKVLKLLQLTPNLIRHKNNHSYPFLF